MSLPDRTIDYGTRVLCTDALGQTLPRVALGPVEGCYDAGGHIQHDFPVVYVTTEERFGSGDDGIAWPLEDVEVDGV